MTKFLILSSKDIVGGAARAAYRLHEAMLLIGADSEMLVQTKYGNSNSVIGAQSLTAKRLASGVFLLDQIPLRSYPKRKVAFFSPQWVPEITALQVARRSPDIINLHWVNNGFLRIETLKQFQAPIIWTMHDMWPFTGGCHYSAGCDRYSEGCGRCPLLGSVKEKDLSHRVWRRKAENWKDLNITIVALSNWLADCARRSSLFGGFPVNVIPNCIDPSVWKPVDKDIARHKLNLPKDKKIVGFAAFRAAWAERKGFHMLMPALEILKQSNLESELELAILGASQNKSMMDLATKTHALGEINDNLTLALFYSAIDVFVLPSMEDNLPNTIMEALACGTPCVAFDIGGVPDMIDHEVNGYLCRPFESQDLADGISWVLEDDDRRKGLSDNARQKVIANYAPKVIAHQYLDLYRQIFH